MSSRLRKTMVVILVLWLSPDALGQEPTVMLRYRPEGDIRRIAFSPTAQVLASLELIPTGNRDEDQSGYFVALWDVPARKEVKRLAHKSRLATGNLVFSPDGKQLATVDDEKASPRELLEGDEHQVVKIWSMPSGEQSATLECSSGVIADISYSPDGKTLATSHSDKIVLWDLSSLRKKLVIPLPDHLSPDEDQLSRIAAIAGIGVPRRGPDIAFSSSGESIAVGTDKAPAGLRFYDSTSGRVLEGLDAENCPRSQAVVSPDGKSLVTIHRKRLGMGRCDDKIVLWNLVTRKQVALLYADDDGGVNCFRFSPDGRLAAGGINRLSGALGGQVTMWDVVLGKEIKPRGYLDMSIREQVHSVDFSPDRKYVVWGASDAILVWDIRRWTGDLEPKSGPDFRLWTDSSGTFQVEAKMIDHDAESVVIEKRNGVRLKVPRTRLSHPDEEHVRISDR